MPGRTGSVGRVELMSKIWKVRVWCRDCGNGQDPQGCFDGGHEVLDDTFETEDQAEDAGADYCNGPPWDWETFQEALNPVVGGPMEECDTP